MCGTAAHLVDHVLPDAPVRQWVLTAPHDVRRLLALHAAALTAMNRVFASEVARWQKATSRAEGGETGSVTFVQRFDSRLGCFVHLHVLALDGVFTDRGDDAVDFHPGRALSWAEVREVARRVGVRMARWLRRRGFLGERAEDERAEQPAPSALEACMRAGGTYARMETDASEPEADVPAHSSKSRWAADVGGFDVHAGVTVRAGDREGLERLCRYGARPPFSLERLSLLPDGRVAYRLRKPRRDGATHLVLTPMQFLAKLAALVPPPRYPLTRFAGVLAPGSPWRARVVAHRTATAPRPAEAAKPVRPRKKRREEGEPAAEAPPRGPRTSLGAGVVTPCYARVDWASLLRRVYLVDVLSCPCGGRRALLADVTDAATVTAILAHLGLATEPPPVARARDPTGDAA